ncbi:biopolymer transporter ExbD [Ramlibacter sp. RBP-2]|uniref:Biopolymer transporter ExbD n=1 Tax=Ramlibacter lithotrophicus TaxID=2606681 RepID=A0A7X6DH85_9BURK|nr:biopolymer transporter ExbD [Ramlibacter lithotrophicus]NKE67124.1 biopolymer transporter ExbD [Ramlibacter lithotrophicus]
MGLKSRRFGAGDPEVMMDINTTPLIDVMLVLLVMLIITIPIQLHAVNLEMPVGVPPDNAIKPEKVQIDIDDKSLVYWQGLPVSAEELDQKMTLVAQQPVPPEIHLRPNKDAQYAVFANVLSTTKRKGLTKVAVIGSEQFVQ